MTWTVSRNNHINEAINDDRAKQTLCLIKDRLKAGTVPWTVVGSGTGLAGTYNMTGTDLLPTFPSIVGVNNNAWICLQNTEGVQVVFQVTDQWLYFYWCGDGGYESSGDEDADSRPGNTSPPAKEIDMTTSGTGSLDVAISAAHYKSVAVEDNGHGFIMFGKYQTNPAFHCSLLKCECDPLDVDPYVATHWNTDSTVPWSMDSLESISTPGTRQMWHPSAVSQVNMAYTDLYSANTDVFGADLQVNPYSNKTQLAGIPVWCLTNPYKFLKGSMPGLYRVPENKSMGDKFESGEFMNMKDIAVPWGSAVDELL